MQHDERRQWLERTEERKKKETQISEWESEKLHRGRETEISCTKVTPTYRYIKQRAHEAKMLVNDWTFKKKSEIL